MAQFATVVAITGHGTVYAVNAQGSSRVLKMGDALQKGEAVRTVGDVRAELLMDDGRLLAIAPAHKVLLDDNVSQSEQSPTAQDSAVTTTPATVDAVIQALERGADLNQALEATAAGLAAGGGNDNGNSFVQLLRITEGVEPLAYNYSFTAPGLPPDLPAVPEEAITTSLRLTADHAVFEGSQGITYTITLGQPAITDMTITLSNEAVILIPAGSATGTVLVPVQGDDVYVDGQTIQVTVGAVQGGGFGSVTVDDTPAITVVNDTIDTVSVKVSIAAEGPVTEAETANFRVSVNQVLDHDLTVTLSDGHAVVIKAGESSVLYGVAPQGDDVYKDAGSVTLSVTGATVVGHTFENLQLGSEAATVSIIDTIDVVTLGMAGPASVTEGNVASPYTLTLSAPAQTDVLVHLAYSGQARDGTDFVGVATVTIPAGASTAAFSLATLNDSLLEGAETFNVTIASASGGNFESLQIDTASSHVVTTIIDNDTPVFTLSGDATVVEGAAANYAITLTGASLEAGQSVTLTIGTGLAVDTASENVDYNSHDGTLTVTAPSGGWAIGAQVATFTVPTVNDTLVEGPETYTVELTAATLGTAGGSVVTTIVDNDAPPIVVTSIETSAVVVTEGQDAVFTMNVTGAATGSTVSLLLTDGTAVNADYNEAYFQYSTDGGDTWNAVTGPINVLAGNSTLLVKTDTFNDLIDENDESFTLTGELSSLGVTYSDSATATIVDNDTPVFTLSGDATVVEGAAANYAITLTGASLEAGQSVTLTIGTGLAVDTASENVDYNSHDGTLTVTAPSGGWAIGAQVATFTVPTVNDTLVEGPETYTVELTAATLGTAGGSVVTTIVDNDTPVFTLSGDATVLEGAAANYAITLTGASLEAGQSVTLSIGTGLAVDTASENVDYNSHDGTLTVTAPSGGWAIGAQVATFTVPTANDTLVEGPETYTVELTAATLGTAGGSVVTTIVDNDAPPIVVTSIETSAVVVTEGQDAVFTMNVTGAATGSTVSLLLTDGTAVNADYNEAYFQYSTDGGATWNAVTGPINVLAGNSTLLVKTDTFNDLIDENDESFTLTGELSSLGVTYSDSATATIVDNDATPRIGEITVSVSEEGLAGGNPDAVGSPDVTNDKTTAGSIGFTGNGAAPLTVELSLAGLPPLTSGGDAISWSYGASHAVVIGATISEPVIQITLNAGSTTVDMSGANPPASLSYEVKLLAPVDHPDATVEDALSFSVGISLSDGINPSDTGAIAVVIEDDSPTALPATLTGIVDEDGVNGGMAGGTGDVAGQETVASGNVSTLFNSGADVPLSYSLSATTSGLPALTSDGVVVTYAVAGDTLTASAGANTVFTFTVNATTGAYTFTLLDQLDHPSLNGLAGDNTENDLMISLGSIVQATDRDGDTVTAASGGLVITVNDDMPTVVNKTDLIYANSSNDGAGSAKGGTGIFDYSIGADGRTTFSASNSDFSTITLSGAVGPHTIVAPTVTWLSESSGAAVFTIAFDYAKDPTNPTVLTHETGLVTFDKVAGTYNVELAQPIESFSILSTSSGAGFVGYQAGGSTVDTSQPDVMVTTVAPNFFVQFTGDHATSGGGGLPLQSSTSGTPNAYTSGELLSAADTWVSVSGLSNGVAGDTVGKGEVLDFNFYSTNPTGSIGLTQTAQASAMFLRFDSIGNTEDLVVNLKLYDTVSHTYTTQAVVIDNGDILKNGDTLPAGYTHITALDKNDGLVIIESNDYNTAATHYVIVGAQVITSTEGLTGSGINLNGATGSGGASTVTENFGAVTTDADIVKISDIGIVTQTTNTQDAHLIFQFTNVDVDGDQTATQTLNVAVEASTTFAGTANAEAIQGANGNDLLAGGGGNDTLTGGLGVDTFKWSLGDQGSTTAPASDVIKDFTLGSGGDVLDLRDLLQGEVAGTGAASATSLSQYLHFTDIGGKAVLSVDHDAGTFAATQTITFDNMSKAQLESGLGLSAGASDVQILQKLLDNGNLSNT